MPLSPGDVVVERYRVEDLLAQGGMSAVYRVWDLRLHLPRALKEMVPYPGLDARALTQLREQFFQEAQVLAELRHPNMPRVIDHFEDHGNAYLVMDFVEGQRLDSIIEEQGAIPEDVLLGWARELLDALAYCHQQGVLHRDVKPQNVIITPQGIAMLVDFGLAKLLDIEDRHTRTVLRGLGTPEYAPPEQYDAEPGSTDERSDIYSLGATLHQALTGNVPPTATQRIVDPSLLRPVRQYLSNISPNLEEAILKAQSLQPDQRFQTVREMAEAIFGPSVSKPTSKPLGHGARPTSDPLATVVLSGLRRIPRQRLWAGAGGGVLVLVVLLVALRGRLPLTSSATSTPTPTVTVAATGTPSPTATGTRMPSATPTDTREPTPVSTATATHTATPTWTKTATPTVTPTPSPTLESTEVACLYDVELVDVREIFTYWFVNSRPSFTLILRNSGTCPWPESTRMLLVSENTFNWPATWDVGVVAAGETSEIEIQLSAPSTPQTLHIVWQLEGPAGQPIGSEITYALRVELRPTSTATQAPMSTATATTQPPPPGIPTWTRTPTPVVPTPSRTPTPSNTPAITPTWTRPAPPPPTSTSGGSGP